MNAPKNNTHKHPPKVTTKCSQLGPDEACGYLPIAGLLKMAKNHKYKIKRIDLCNSGDTSGSKDSVVGYGTWIFHK